MKVAELTDALGAAGFVREELDSGCNFIRKEGHFTFICYIEPEMDILFISIYHWNNNDVKGTHNVSLKEFSRTQDSAKMQFEKTKNNLPQRIGEFVDTHEQLDKVIGKIFL